MTPIIFITVLRSNIGDLLPLCCLINVNANFHHNNTSVEVAFGASVKLEQQPISNDMCVVIADRRTNGTIHCVQKKRLP